MIDSQQHDINSQQRVTIKWQKNIRDMNDVDAENLSGNRSENSSELDFDLI